MQPGGRLPVDDDANPTGDAGSDVGRNMMLTTVWLWQWQEVWTSLALSPTRTGPNSNRQRVGFRVTTKILYHYPIIY